MIPIMKYILKNLSKISTKGYNIIYEVKNMSLNQYTKVFTKSYQLEAQHRLSEGSNKADLSKVLSLVLQTSDEHDQAVKQTLNASEYIISEDQTWVITQNRMVIHQWPEINRTISISTHVMEANRFFITRQFVVEADDIELMTLFFQFAAIDFTSRKMMRLNYETLPELLDLNAEIKVNFSRLKVPTTAKPLFEQELEILPTDIDSNQHVNNLVYFRWAYYALKDQMLADNQHLATVEIKFGNEVFPGQALMLLTYQKQQNEFVQTDQIVYNKTLDKEACHIRMTWKKEK